MSDPELNWSFVEDEIARLLEEIRHEDATRIQQDRRPSKTYLWLRAASMVIVRRDQVPFLLPRLVRSLAHS
jgi:hypothetical protein